MKDDPMFDATKLLGGFLQTRQSGSSGSGIGGMVQQAISHFSGGTAGAGRPGGGLASGGLASGLGALLNQFTGSSQPTSAQPASGQSSTATGSGMIEQIGDLARRAANAPMTELRGNNPAAVGGAGALAGALMGGGKGALGGGLLAVLGSLAYSAYQNQGARPGAQLGTPASAPASDQALQAYADPAEIQRRPAWCCAP